MNTERVILNPENEQAWLNLRTQDITSTDCAALFGISPYMTPFELWHRKKKSEIVPFEGNERINWGQRLQDAIAGGIISDNQWSGRKMTEYIRWPDARIGASFDWSVQDESALLEIKNVDSLVYKDGWITEGENVEAPPHIELQVQHQLLVSDRQLTYVGALVGGNRVILIRRERDEKICGAILARVKQFWDSIDNNIEPEPDFKRDASFISELYKYADPSKVFDATGNTILESLAKNYKKAGDAAKLLDEEKKGYKAQILTIIGDAAKVVAPTFSISAGLIGPTEVSYTREGYRDFRLFQKKTKEPK